MKIVCLLFEELTALDAIGPYEVLSRIPGADFTFAGKQRGVVRSDSRALGLCVDAALDEIAQCDLLLVPGGFGARKACSDADLLSSIRALDKSSQITASVCTGSILLGAAGLLSGRRATTHWAYMAQLAERGAHAVSERYVRDGKYASSAGVSAGIDLALALVLELFGREVAESIQLSIEYDPAPPLSAGRPDQVSPALRERLYRRSHARDRELAPCAHARARW